MNKEKLYELVKKDLLSRYDECQFLGEPDEIIDFMDLAMNRVEYQNKFKNFTEWLLHLGLSDKDIMWVYTELNNVQ